MGWNGSGTFNRSDGTRSGTQVWQDAKTAGVKIRADDHDVHDQDIADGLENTVALDGQTTTTTDNAILRYDSGNTKFEGVTISASQIVGRSAAGDTRGMSAATARQTIGVGSAAPTNNQFLYWASASSQYVQAAAATARSLIGLGTAAPTNNQVLAYSSSASMYQQTLVDTANIAANAVTYAKVSFSNDIVAGDIAAGAVGASEIATGAVGASEIATGAVGASEIAAGAVGQSEVAASAIGQGELKATNGTVTHTGNTSVTHKTLPGGVFGFYSRTKIDSSASTYTAQMADGHNGTSLATIISLRVSDSSRTVSANQHYVQASPPYDMGDGECGLFVETDVLTNGAISGLYVAPDPVWANNGPTNIRPDRIDKKTGKKYKRVRRPAVTLADVDAGRADLSDYIAAQAEATVEEVEVTHALKNADMDAIPHSWASPPEGTIVLLDPVNTHDLLMLHEAGEDVSHLIHRGYIQIGDEVQRKGPPGVMPVSWKWKNSR